MSADQSKFLGAHRALTDAERGRLRSAQHCFQTLDQFFEAREGYPEGHPEVRGAVDEIARTFRSETTSEAFFVAGISEAGFHQFGTGRPLWQTERALRIARSALSLDVRFLVFHAWIERPQLHRLLDVLDRLRESDDLSDAALAFDGVGVRLDAIDRSAATLAGISRSQNDDEPASETRAVHKLFRNSFDTPVPASNSSDDGDSLLGFLTNDAEADPEITPEAQMDAAFALRRDLTSRERTEVRRAAALCSALSNALDATTRNRLLDKARRTLEYLLEQGEFESARKFVDELELWHEELAEILSPALVRRFLESVAGGTTENRREILALFRSWNREEEIDRVAALLDWRLPDAAKADLVEFFGTVVENSADRLPRLVDRVTTESAVVLVEHAGSNLPQARGPLLELLDRDVSPAVQAAALEMLRGHFAGLGQIDEYVVPLLGSPNSKLRNSAIESLVEIAPDQVADALDPFINKTLAQRSDRDLEKLVENYATFGDDEALAKLRSLIRVRRLGSEEERELAIRIVEALEGAEGREVDELLADVADEWTVAGDVQDACERILEAHGVER